MTAAEQHLWKVELVFATTGEISRERLATYLVERSQQLKGDTTYQPLSVTNQSGTKAVVLNTLFKGVQTSALDVLSLTLGHYMMYCEEPSQARQLSHAQATRATDVHSLFRRSPHLGMLDNAMSSGQH